MRPRLITAGLLAAASLALGSGAAAGTTAAPVAATPAEPTIKITSVSPGSLDADHALVVKGTLRNPGAAIAGATLRLRLDHTVLDTRAEVDEWMGVTKSDSTSTDASITTDTTDQVTTGELLPGALTLPAVAANSTVPFTLTVPAGDSGLTDQAWAFGPRGLTVQLARKSDELAAARTLIVWTPEGATSSAQLSLLVPMTSALPTTDAGAADEANAALLAPGGRLNRVLNAVQDDAVDWAIDPAVLQAADELRQSGVTAETPADSATGPTGDDASVTPPASAPGGTAASPGTVSAQEQQIADARSWLTSFTGGMSERVLIGLPYADPDLNSVLDNKQVELLRTTDRLGKAVLNDLGVKADRTVAWPGDGKVSSRAIVGLRSVKRSDVLLASANQPPESDLDYTPTGRSGMKVKNTRLGGLLYDEQLSALFTASGGATSATSTQWMLAELAAIGLENPNGVSHVLAVAPRTWNPTPANVNALVGALHAAPYVDLQNLNSLRSADQGAIDRKAPQFSKESGDQELPLGHITAVARLNDGLTLMQSAAVDATDEITRLRERLASLLSVSWRGRDVWNARLDVSKVVTPVASGVKLVVGSRSRLFTAHQSVMPVTVENNTPFTVKVQVQLVPRSGQLTFEGPKLAQLGPNQRKAVQVPTTAVAGGDVNVEAQLLSPAGDQLVGSQTFRVLVRPNWERVGMIGAGSILGLLFLIGLLRSIRRGRTRVPAESVPDVDDIATAKDPRTGSLDAAAIAAAAAKAKENEGTDAEDAAGQLVPAGPPAAPEPEEQG